MDERIIDDEYGKGIRLRKTQEGYVEATDESLETSEDTATEELEVEFPVLETEEDDEDLVGLSPEEALKLRRKKEEEARARKAEYERLCGEGLALLETGDFQSAELKFEKALMLDDEAVDASVGYWRAKTANFTDPDVLVSEYAEASIESLENDLGVEAVERIKKDYQDVFQRKYKELCDEEKSLVESIEEKKAYRKGILKTRFKKSGLVCLCTMIPMLVLGVLTAIIGMQNFVVREDTYVVPTIILGVATFVFFIAFILLANKWINVVRLLRANEKLESTEDGRRVLEIRDYKQIYVCLLLEKTEETA